MPALILERVYPQGENKTNEEQLYQQLTTEIESCLGLNKVKRNRVKTFLAENQIWHISEMDYPLRKSFEEYMKTQVCEEAVCAFMLAFDRIKQYSMRQQMQTLEGRLKFQWRYEQKILFIPYHSDYEIAMRFDSVRHRSNMVWDFQKSCSEKMKRQVFEILNYIIENYEQSRLREYKLSGLQYLYNFCISYGIDDIEALETVQVEEYEAYVCKQVRNSQRLKRMQSIIDTARTALFVRGEKIHWNAAVWYMERFHLAAERVNPSKRIERISFLEITYLPNRKLLQEFMKYELGVTDLSISNIYEKFRIIRRFLQDLNDEEMDVCICSVKRIDSYINGLEKSAKTFNGEVIAIQYFFRFLVVRGYIPRVPFYAQYYLRKEVPIHHDRTVAEEVCMEIIGKLHNFPEHLRLMFLHLWCLGLRISEVCTLKGNSYYRQGQDTWIQVYQVKMHTFKRIPIPEALYRLMEVYIRKHEISAEDYIFQNRNGGAFSYRTFRWQMVKFCNENQIEGGEYLFKSHDYRHTVATMYYDNGVSIQSIRDYLGHNYEEMTQQYIDYIPRKIAKANESYFADPANSLAASLKKGGKNGE